MEEKSKDIIAYCKNCEKEFISFHKNKKYCCDKCRNEAKLKEQRSAWHDIKCEYCNKIFQTKKDEKYCSKKCEDNANKQTKRKRKIQSENSKKSLVEIDKLCKELNISYGEFFRRYGY